MEYSLYHYNHVGHYRCTACGFHRQEPDFAGTALDLEGGSLTIDGAYTIPLAFRSIYNVYNILAAWSACSLAGADPGPMAQLLGQYVLKNGRMVRFRLGAHRGTLLTSKHENSVAYDTNLRYIAQTQAPCSVLVIVDAVSRKYFTGEVSWLWDIDFDQLACPQVEHVYLCGTYVNDLALRFDYTAVPPERIVCRRSIQETAQLIRETGDEDLYVVTCFSDRDKLLALTQRDA